jgi:hypothetical protein
VRSEQPHLPCICPARSLSRPSPDSLRYAHSRTTVILMTELPAGSKCERTYDSRGWTTFERCCAELLCAELRLARWRLVIDLGRAEKGGAASRQLPTTPAMMKTLLAAKNFTNGADMEAVQVRTPSHPPRISRVLFPVTSGSPPSPLASALQALYDKLATACLGGVKELSFSGIRLRKSNEWLSPSRLARALLLCHSLEKLDLKFCGLTNDGLEQVIGSLDKGALPSLKSLALDYNRFGADGIRSLGAKLANGVAPNLEDLGLGALGCGDQGAQALAVSLSEGAAKKLASINFSFNGMSDTGALALAAQFVQTHPKVLMNFPLNRVGMRGRSAMVALFELQHGPSYVHLVLGIFNAGIFPPGVGWALGIGLRACGEVNAGDDSSESN